MAQALRLRHVLCPIDFSGFSRDALSHATALARALGGDLTAVYVCPPDVPLGGEFGYLAPSTLEPAARADLLQRLAALADPGAADVRVQSLLLEGDPSKEVVRLATELPADLLVLGLHPDSHLKHFLLGSMTEELLRLAPCPVLTVRHGVGPAPEAGAPFRRIVCASDLRGPSCAAARYALALAEALSAELFMLHVLEHVPEFESGGLPFSAVEVQSIRQTIGDDVRARLHATVPESGRDRVAVRDLVKAGHPHEVIVRLAREEGADLVVLGAHGHGALERMLFGSTSRRVAREAPCPVLVVRGAPAGAERALPRDERRHALA
jgi:nucleotide-binding universal stress UspA family protein